VVYPLILPCGSLDQSDICLNFDLVEAWILVISCQIKSVGDLCHTFFSFQWKPVLYTFTFSVWINKIDYV